MKLPVIRSVAAGLLFTSAALHAQPTVRGQVLDRLGSPLAGSRVELVPIPTGYQQGLGRLAGRDPLAVATAKTDTFGRFLLAAGGPGVFAVRVSAAGRIPLTFEPLPLVEETELPPAALPEDAGAALVVRDAVGHPAAGVWVLAEGEEETSLLGGWRIAPRVGRTAGDGSLTLPRLANEKLRVRAFFGAGIEEVWEAFPGDLRLSISQFLERRLRVVDSKGQGVADVLVRLGDAAWPVGLTDGEGRLAIRTRADRSVRVRLATVDGRRLATNLGLARAGDGPTEEESLVLEDALFQVGRVRQEEDARPLAGALVWSGTDPGAFSLTDPEGHYRIPSPKGSALWLEANAPGRLPKRALVEPRRSGAGPAPTLALMRAGEIVGRVVDAKGAAISTAWVSALSATEPAAKKEKTVPRQQQTRPAGAATAANGGFRLGRLRPGELYSIRAAKPGFLPSTTTAMVPVSSGRPTSVTLVLAPTRAAIGRVLDVNGWPVARAEIRLAQTETSASALPSSRRREPPDGVSDARGRFTAAAIPALALDIEVLRSGYARSVIRNFKVPPGPGPVDFGAITLRPGVAVTGIVMDGRDQPISGARVYRVEELDAPSELAERLRDVSPETTTGADGRFSLSDQARDLPIHLLVSARGFLPSTARGVRPPASSLRIRLEAGTRFVGRVLDTDRLPVARANVALSWQATALGHEFPIGPPVVKTAITGREGRFEVADMPSGRAELSVSATGFVAVEEIQVSLPQASGKEETVVLAHGSTLEGRVSTTAGDPVPGVRISAGLATCFSDDDGAFRTDGVPSEPLLVVAFHPHYPIYRQKTKIEEGVNHLEVTFEAGSAVRGRVVDEVGTPVAGATAILQPDGRGAASNTASTDFEGVFTLEPVPAGRYRLSATAPGYMVIELEQPVTVGRESVEGLEIKLEKGGAVTGQILGLTADELSRVAVRAEHESGESRYAEVDATGKYALRHLRAGGWLIQAFLIEGRRQARARVLLAPGGEETQDLRFGGGLTLSGKVLYHDQALADARVSIRGQRLAVERSLITDYEGSFRFEDLDADTYLLGLNQTSELVVHNETIELASDRDILIQIERQTVAGTVKDKNNEDPIADAMVTLQHLADDDGPEFLIGDASDTSGTFRLERVPPGRYRLRVSHEGYSPAEDPVEVAHGSDLLGLQVALQSTQGAELVVRRASGSIPALLHLKLLSPSGTPVLAESRQVGEGGRVRLSSVPYGSWVLLAASAGGALTSVQLSVPGKPVELTLPDAAHLDVRVSSLTTSDAIGTVSIISTNGQALQMLDLGGILKQSWPLIAGRGTVEAVPAGNWVVSATASDGRSWSLPVKTDGRTPLQIDLSERQVVAINPLLRHL